VDPEALTRTPEAIPGKQPRQWFKRRSQQRSLWISFRRSCSESKTLQQTPTTQCNRCDRSREDVPQIHGYGSSSLAGNPSRPHIGVDGGVGCVRVPWLWFDSSYTRNLSVLGTEHKPKTVSTLSSKSRNPRKLHACCRSRECNYLDSLPKKSKPYRYPPEQAHD